LKVIAAGYTRTGTVSLKAALETLGVGPCLHPLTTPASDRVLARARSRTFPPDWRGDLEAFNSAAGWVGARHYRELMDAWPSSLVLLSVRDPQAWYRSYASCLRATRDLAMAGGSAIAAAEEAASDALMMLERPLWKGILDGSYENYEDALDRFQRHNADVANTVPHERLLVYDVEQGWDPLCAFLDVAVPDAPFPHLNERDEFWTRFAPRRGPAARRRLVRATTPRITGLSVVDAGQRFTQQEILEALGMANDPFARGIFERCGVNRRNLTLFPDNADSTLQGRTTASEDKLLEHAVRAVDGLGIDRAEIDIVLSASLFSLGGPTLAHRLVEHYGMRPTIDKYHVTGVGCASAVPLIRLMSSALGGEGRKGLIVAAENMSGLLTHARPDDPRAKIVGAAIFGDGCAAATIESGAKVPGPAVVASTVHQLPGTLDIVHMALSDDDGHLALARELPDIASAGLATLVDEFLRPLGLTRHSIDHWMIHPGGRRILECVQSALDLSRDEVTVSYDMLAEHGNTGTPSIFYVLAETISRRAPAPGHRGLMVTVGPGITLGLMLLVF
jgi:predicted naringenin-chalcone synthase